MTAPVQYPGCTLDEAVAIATSHIHPKERREAEQARLRELLAKEKGK